MTSTVRRYGRQPETLEDRLPIAAPPIGIKKGATAAQAWPRPRLQPSRSREHAMQLAAPPRAAYTPLEQQRAQARPHWDFPGAGFCLRHLSERAVAFLDPADPDYATLEINLVP